jgi:hypothetical protein
MAQTGGAVGVPEPGDGDERDLLLGWLAFHRDALGATCAGLTDTQLVERSATPSTVSLLGLVRHMADMERVFGVWANACTSELVHVWGQPPESLAREFDCDASEVAASMRAWRDEKASTDGVIRELDLDDSHGANGRSVRWNLQKLVGEYARTSGLAELVRQRIEGATGNQGAPS